MATGTADTEFLFSYGTLQLAEVQLSLFGRRLAGSSDVLEGFKHVPLQIDDQTVVEISGKSQHTMASFTGRAADTVSGSVLGLTAEEIRRADGYEVPAVTRVAVRLRSGVRAWAYVDARYPPSDP
jgi:hypothetical protein